MPGQRVFRIFQKRKTNRYAGKKTAPAAKDLPGMWPPVFLEKKMGAGMGAGQILQQALQGI